MSSETQDIPVVTPAEGADGKQEAEGQQQEQGKKQQKKKQKQKQKQKQQKGKKGKKGGAGPSKAAKSTRTLDVVLGSEEDMPETPTQDRYSQRTVVRDVLTAGKKWIGSVVFVAGWIRTVRKQASRAFVELTDGSTIKGVQIIVTDEKIGFEALSADGYTGTAIKVSGTIVESPGKNQVVEIQATTVEILGTTVPEEYPLAKNRISLEKLRTMAHLRVRTKTIQASARVRNAMADATHRFFQSIGCQYVHTPIITASDCEGAGEMFRVTTAMDGEGNIESIPATEEGKVDFSEDFFGKAAMLTVSGQLNVETYCMGLSSVYTFGPTFRAEYSFTSRHLSEFWMVEPELAFADIHNNMDCAEDYLKFCVRAAMERCSEEINFFDKWVTPGLIDKLYKIVESDFVRITYTDAIKQLEAAIAAGEVKFENKVEWGVDLASEHEKYLCEVTGMPTIVYNYPKAIKSFYMRVNDRADDEPGDTVAAMDLLVPGVGELIGGSQREERYDVLVERIQEDGMDIAPYSWYLDLRKYGSVVHSGFGLGFERLVMLVTGLQIRDVIPFPRYPKHAEY